MSLVVDLGNSRCKWARVGAEGLAGHGVAAWDGDDVEALLDRCWGAAPVPARVLIANVAGAQAGERVAAWIARRWDAPCRFVSPQVQAHGVRCAYAEPATLGADRWAMLIAARREFVGPVAVVGCGTALTLDVLDEAEAHLGGLIAPGVSLMRRALHEHTRGLPLAADGPLELLARSTPAAITAGTLYAAAALVDRALADLAVQLARPFTFVLTGGEAERLRPLLGRDCVAVPDLVLRGLAVISEDAP